LIELVVRKSHAYRLLSFFKRWIVIVHTKWFQTLFLLRFEMETPKAFLDNFVLGTRVLHHPSQVGDSDFVIGFIFLVQKVPTGNNI
jgi:hypothetical protein